MNRIEIIKAVLEECNQQDLTYCLLRNYDFLLENRATVFPSERSVDLVVARQDLAAWEKVMSQHGFQPRWERYSRCHKAYFQVPGREPVSFDVQVGGVSWNDLVYLPEGTLLARRVRCAFFYVPSPDDQFIMLVVHSVLGKRYFKEEYKTIISSRSPPSDREYVQGVFSAIFGRPRAQQLYDLVTNQQFESILAQKYRFILAFLFQSEKRLFPFLSYAFRYQKWNHFRVYPLISIIGPDGAGKSTLAVALLNHLKEQNRKAVIVYAGRGRGNLLPMTRVGRKYKNQERQHDQTRLPPLRRRKLLYTLAFPVFVADQLLRYLVYILPRRRRRTVVITDRYCSDLLLMKHVPLPLKRVALFLFPRPTMTFYLSNAPEVLHSRRPQEPIEELQRQLGLFTKLKSRLSPYEILANDVDKNTTEAIQQVMSHIYREWY